MKSRSAPDPDSLTIFGHLNELRGRLLKALLATALTTVISFTYAGELAELLARPIGGLANLQAIRVTENIGVFMRVALLGGMILAMPVIVYQLLMFILPGLNPKEKLWIYIGVPAATLLFLSGVAFAYLVMLPTAIPFLLAEILPEVRTIPTVSDYLEFVTSLLFWVGVSFEVPLLIFLLAKLHLVSPQSLLHQWRLAIVIIAIIAAVVTPTADPVNMGLLMLPLMVLYLLSIVLAFIAWGRQPAAR